MSKLASNTETHSGMFWPVGQEERAWSGQLQLARFGSGKIVMASVLEDNSAPAWLNENHAIILGRTSHRETWTLEDCRGGDESQTFAEIHFTSNTIWFRRAWRGAHLTHAQLHRLESAELQFEGIHPFVESDSVTSRTENGKRLIEIPEPSIYTCVVNGGRLSLTAEYRLKKIDGLFSLIPRTLLRYEPSESGSWPKTYAETLHHANNFLSFLARADLNPKHTWMTIHLADEGSSKRIELLKGDAAATSLDFRQEHLAEQNIERTSLTREALLQNWMKAKDKISYSFYSYWLTISGGPIVEQGRFLFSVAALEGIDRARRGKLQGAANKLEERLIHLFQKTEVCSLWDKAPDNAAKEVTNARNSVMHLSEGIGTKPDVAAALWMTQLCEAVYEQNLWEILGVPTSVAAKMSYENAKNRLWRFVPELPAPSRHAE